MTPVRRLAGKIPNLAIQFPPVEVQQRGAGEHVFVIVICHLEGKLHDTAVLPVLLHKFCGEVSVQRHVGQDDVKGVVQRFLHLGYCLSDSGLIDILGEHAPAQPVPVGDVGKQLCGLLRPVLRQGEGIVRGVHALPSGVKHLNLGEGLAQLVPQGGVPAVVAAQNPQVLPAGGIHRGVEVAVVHRIPRLLDHRRDELHSTLVRPPLHAHLIVLLPLLTEQEAVLIVLHMVPHRAVGKQEG